MYQPVHFQEDDLGVQHALIRAHPLGLLISNGPDGILANPIPFLIYENEGPFGTLRCHLSRANPQGQALGEWPDVLVVFQGAERYITPTWYATKAEHGKVVPTWNYATVQARGIARPSHDPAWLHAHVSALSTTHEAGRPEPWAVADAPEDYVAGQLRGIVGIEIVIDAIDGKWKVSQNRADADRLGVADGLKAQGDDVSLAMAAIVRLRGGN
jgi:transcriptional regulator